MNTPLLVIFATVILDAMGMGLVTPITPVLLREVGHVPDVSWQYSLFLALYALMQFLFSPVLGALSDKHGRRPVLLVSLAGAAVDYTVMAMAPTLWLLYLSRAVAGITGATTAVAGACVADISAPVDRTRRFGQLAACFGLGFIAGPLLGGWLGAMWIRAPFYAAAVLNFVNLVFTYFALPESRRHEDKASKLSTLNPVAPLRWALGFRALLPMVFTYFIMALVGQVGATVWMLYGEDKFAWDTATIGLSLAGFGLLHAISQAFVAGPVAERWSNRMAMVLGIACDAAANVLMGLATHSWMVVLLMPLFCLGGIGVPALQSMMTTEVDDHHQGELQGVLASLNGLASVVGPPLIGFLYFMSRGRFPGFVWIFGAFLYVLCLPLLRGNAMSPSSAPAATEPEGEESGVA